MREKRSKTRSKWRCLRNLRKYRTGLKNNGVKMMVTALDPTYAIFYVRATTPKVRRRKKLTKNAIFVLLNGLEFWHGRMGKKFCIVVNNYI